MPCTLGTHHECWAMWLYSFHDNSGHISILQNRLCSGTLIGICYTLHSPTASVLIYLLCPPLRVCRFLLFGICLSLVGCLHTQIPVQQWHCMPWGDSQLGWQRGVICEEPTFCWGLYSSWQMPSWLLNLVRCDAFEIIVIIIIIDYSRNFRKVRK